MGKTAIFSIRARQRGLEAGEKPICLEVASWILTSFTRKDIGGEFTERARGRPKGPHSYGYERHFATSIHKDGEPTKQ